MLRRNPLLVTLSTQPPWGASPLKVAFSLATTVANITTPSLDVGDGTRTVDTGKSPASLAYTYLENRIFLAHLIVAQQQHYGGV